MTKKLLLLTCALGAISGGASVSAAYAADTTSPSATEVGAVIVTAEKRQQNIQKVPVAVTAFTTKQRDLVGIENLQDMTNFTPGLVYSSVLDRVTLRGVGRQTNLLSADAAVTTYVDGFFTTSAVEASKPPMFVSNIEVLRGPQGTLQGRNAIGGALLVTTARPSSTPHAEARVTIGNYGYEDFEAYVTGPIADGLNFRLQGYDTIQTQGYFKNVAGGPTEGNVFNEQYIEPSISAKLGDNAELYAKAFAANWNNRGGPGARANYTTGPYGDQVNDASNSFLFNAAAPYYAQNYTTAGPLGSILPGSLVQNNASVTNNPTLTNNRDFSTNTPLTVKLRNSYDFDTEFTYHFPGFDFKYTGGYQSYKYNLFLDADGTDVDAYTFANVANPTCAAGGASCVTVYPTWNYSYEEDNQWFSHEITFASTGAGAFQWIGGLYYYDEHYSNPIITTAPQQTQLANPVNLCALLGTCASLFGAPNPNNYVTYQNYELETRSEAAYGQIDWKFTDTLKLTLGARYTQDHKEGSEQERLVFFGGSILSSLYKPGPFTGGNIFDPSYNGLITPLGTPATDVTSCPAVPAGGLAKGVTSGCTINSVGQATRSLGADYGATTGTAGLEWTPTSDILAYARYSRGYKSFALNAGNLSEFPYAKPEFVNAYEIGYKQTFGRNLVVDADIYYYDFQDAQYPLSTAIPVAGGGTQNVSLLTNLPKARVDGFELESIWTPINHLQFDLSYSFNDTSILTGCTPSTGVGCYEDTNDPAGLAPGARVVVPATLTTPALQTVKGNQLPNAPRNKVALNGNYTFVFDPGSLTFSATGILRDQQYGAIFKEPYNSAPSWSQVDLRASWKAPDDKYEIILYGRNVFNTHGYEAAAVGGIYNSGPISAPVLQQNHVYGINPPATYGVEFHYKFF